MGERMSGATSLALARRLDDPRYAERWFVGRGLDIGAGPDGLGRSHTWPHATIREWDLGDGDATTLPGIAAESFDFVYSSHCLEHLDDPMAALRRWWEVVKSGGYLVVVVPDFEMYERGVWPSRIQPEGHKTRWTKPRLIDAIDRMAPLAAVLVECQRLTDRFDPTLPIAVDQTTPPHNAECGIEAIVRKPA